VEFKREEYESLRHACNELYEAQKGLKWLEKELEESVTIKLAEIRQRVELSGVSTEEAFRGALKAGMERKELAQFLSRRLYEIGPAIDILRVLTWKR